MWLPFVVPILFPSDIAGLEYTGHNKCFNLCTEKSLEGFKSGNKVI